MKSGFGISVRLQKSVTGKRFGIYDDATGELIEGGYFDYDYACAGAAILRREKAESLERKAGWDASY